MPIRLITYNIHKGIGGRDRRYRLQRVIDVLSQEEPDVVCLQEVTRDTPKYRHDDQPRQLAESLSAVGQMYQMNVHYRRGGYGNLVLTRWPLGAHHQISLRLEQKKPRGAQLAEIATPHGNLLVVNCHLGLAEKERQWQVKHLLTHHAFREFDTLPAVVAGDCNDWRNQLHRGELAAHGFRQVTSPPSRFRSFPAFLPLANLDKVFVRGTLRVTHAGVVRHSLSRAASDHLPLRVDLEFT